MRNEDNRNAFEIFNNEPDVSVAGSFENNMDFIGRLNRVNSEILDDVNHIKKVLSDNGFGDEWYQHEVDRAMLYMTKRILGLL